MNRPTLYRFFDRDGDLLYVGISSDLTSRIRQHERNKSWWRQVAFVRIEHHRDSDSARKAELRAIADEAPRYNVADRPSDGLCDPLAAELVRVKARHEITLRRLLAFAPDLTPRELADLIELPEAIARSRRVIVDEV